MRILSIGNSFSQDAQRYFYQVAAANGQFVKNVNLYIGGCSLRRHYINALENKKAYAFEFKGENTGLKVSIKEALISDDWDYVTLQQASPLSYLLDSYTPYIFYLRDEIKKYCPKASILIHQTWAYPDFSAKGQGFETAADMFAPIKENYDRICAELGADGIIPSGEAMLAAYEVMGDGLYRDSLHASGGFGRYLLALVWYKKFFDKSTPFRHISLFDAPVTEAEKELACKLVFPK